jgi:hypothetical protein
MTPAPLEPPRAAWARSVYIVAREFFQVSLVTYLLLTLAETLKTGFVSNFFNLNYLLIIVLVTGVAMVLTEPKGLDNPAAKPQSRQAAKRPKTSPRVVI